MFTYCEGFGNYTEGKLIEWSACDKITTKPGIKVMLGFGFFHLFCPVFIFLASFVALVVREVWERGFSV